MNIYSFEHFITRVGRLRLKRCGSIAALTIFVVYAPKSNYDQKEVEPFYVDLEFCRDHHTFFKLIIGDFNAKIGQRKTSEEHHIETHGLECKEQDAPLSALDVESLSEDYNSEMDHILVNLRFCLTDVTVVPKFCTGPDHSVLCARFYFSRKGEKAVGCWEDAAVDNIDEEYNRLIQHLHVIAMKAESSKVTKRPLSPG
uniref:Endo/exonuclease/phosphatase domain-containing protein n=1 Tax=Angiostrongylus cantonensis TaxID=6313 RepID=A0A0K0DC17_ANGCA